MKERSHHENHRNYSLSRPITTGRGADRRQNLGGACYVRLTDAPLTVWRAFKRGNYAAAPLPTGIPLRLGSYGDPCAVPLEVWRQALQGRKHTGYTHQWETSAHAEAYRAILMASCDDASDAARAQAAGWRTFTVGAAPVRSVECLADARGMTCASCGICDGTRGNARRASVWIAPHGPLVKRHLAMVAA